MGSAQAAWERAPSASEAPSGAVVPAAEMEPFGAAAMVASEAEMESHRRRKRGSLCNWQETSCSHRAARTTNCMAAPASAAASGQGSAARSVTASAVGWVEGPSPR